MSELSPEGRVDGVTPEATPDPTLGAQALAEVEPAARALSPDKLRRIAADPMAVIAIILIALSRLQSLRALFAALGASWVAVLDRLQQRVDALRHVELHRPEAVSQTLYIRARALRTRVRNFMVALVQLERLDADAVERLPVSMELKQVAEWFVNAAALLDEVPEALRMVTTDEIAEMRSLAVALSDGPSPEVAAALADWADLRQRLYTLVVDDYEQCQTALRVIRHAEGDADRLAPSPFQRSRKKKPAPAESPASPA